MPASAVAADSARAVAADSARAVAADSARAIAADSATAVVADQPTGPPADPSRPALLDQYLAAHPPRNEIERALVATVKVGTPVGEGAGFFISYDRTTPTGRPVEAKPVTVPAAASRPSIGPENASAVMQVFGGLECPYTKALVPQLIALVSKFDGRVRVVWRDRTAHSPRLRPPAKGAVP